MYDASHHVIGGNATDQALMKMIGEETYSMLYSDTTCTVTVSQGFNSTNKFSQAYIGAVGKTFYKGAPERLLAKANYYLDERNGLSVGGEKLHHFQHTFGDGARLIAE